MILVRTLVLFLLCMALAPAHAKACDLQTSLNHKETARFVENAQTCLRHLPDGFTIDEAVEQDNLRRVNDARLKQGLLPLKFRPDLLETARWHSLDMAANDFFSHRGKDDRTHGLRISLLDRTLIFDVARENIAMVRGDYEPGTEGQLMHELLMESESHFENIMSDDVSHMAVGVIRFGDGVWLTQLFINEAGELSAPAPVRLVPGQILGFEARLNNLEFASFQAEQGDKMRRFRRLPGSTRSVVPEDLSGDIRLGVRGDQAPTSDHEQGFYVNLFGPSMTLVSEK